MDEGFANIVTDLLKEAMVDVRTELKDMFKGTRPFRKVKVSGRERLFNYEQIPQQIKMQFHQQFPQEFALLEQDINKLKEKYYGRTVVERNI